MELLLNLLWIAIALAAYWALARRRGALKQLTDIPYWKAMLALACVLVLLFPVISASDDLHPSQAVLEDATKRIQQALAPSQQVPSGPFLDMLPALLAITLMLALAGSRFKPPVACEPNVIRREHTPRDGRSPPSL